MNEMLTWNMLSHVHVMAAGTGSKHTQMLLFLLHCVGVCVGILYSVQRSLITFHNSQRVAHRKDKQIYRCCDITLNFIRTKKHQIKEHFVYIMRVHFPTANTNKVVLIKQYNESLNEQFFMR